MQWMRVEPKFTRTKACEALQGDALPNVNNFEFFFAMCQSDEMIMCKPLCEVGQWVTRLWTYPHLVHMYKPMLASFYFANKPLVMVPIS